MALNANKAMPIYQERNVNIPQGTKADAAYDLVLYPELGSQTRGVLVVTVIVSFKFKDGESQVPATKGAKLTWTAQGKTDFMNGFRTACQDVWSEQHRLTTTNSIPMIKDVGVLFEVRTAEEMSVLSHSHWNATVTAVDPNWVVSWVRGCGGWISNGESQLDSEDLTPANKGGPSKQRDAVHEFGHMLGLRDEYPAAQDNLNWLGDPGSIMHFSENVRPRHYVFLADWIGRQWNNTTSLVKPIDWKVNGSVDTMNAQI
jgi:hypothetical protein